MDLIHEAQCKMLVFFVPGLAMEFQEVAHRKGIRPQVAPWSLTCR
jgi:hypothetical protein